MNMYAIFRVFLLVGSFVLMTGCATNRVYVNGFLDREQTKGIEASSAIAIIENTQVENPILEKEVQYKIKQLLTAKGHRVTGVDDAQYVLSYSFGVGPGRTISGTMPVYHPGEIIRVDELGDREGRTHTVIQLPSRTEYVPYLQTVYDRWLTVTLANAESYRTDKAADALWLGEATSSGRNVNIRDEINYLLIGVFENFGLNTGQQLSVKIRRNDERLQNLLRP